MHLRKVFLSLSLLTFTTLAHFDTFPLTGEYLSANRLHATVTDTGRLYLSQVAWDYPDTVLNKGGGNYSANGYYYDGTCKVSVATELSYDSTHKNLHLVFRVPKWIIHGPFSCTTKGERVTYHQLKKVSDLAKTWEKTVEGRGCGTNGARIALQKLLVKYGDICTVQGGMSMAQEAMKPVCWPANPGDPFCPTGECAWRANLFCSLP